MFEISEQAIKVKEEVLYCPIRAALFDDPVIADDGHTYEREAITEWVEKKGISPITRDPISNKFIVNRVVRDLVDQYKANIAIEEQLGAVRPIAYSDVLKKLATCLEVKDKEIRYGSIVEQTLVALAGVYTEQKGANFDKEEDKATGWNLLFYLNFASSAEHQLFTTHYTNTYAGSILDNGLFGGGNVKIILNTKVFYEVIATDLGKYKKDSHDILMENLQRILNVTSCDVSEGDAVESRLVVQAGVLRSQKRAYYERNDDNYSTSFHLEFGSNSEYSSFIGYYKQSCPGFIINGYGYKRGELCKIDVNSKLLIEKIAPKLCDVKVGDSDYGCILF